jgi:sensor histidine kinase regulating citrate/malate metabolism
MVIVLGNIIDNQIEAVVQAEHQDIRMAKLSLRMNGNAFLIHAENGKSAKKIARNESEKWFHGLGMKNVMDVLEQYGGSMTTEVQDEWYEMMIMIPICSNL